MAKTKADWLKEANELGLKVTPRNTIAQIKEMIEGVDQNKHDKSANASEHTAKVAKAGKRSAKSVREAEAEKSKADKDVAEDSQETKKGPVPVTRSKLERRSKKYKEVSKLIDKTKEYPLKEATELVIKTATTKFDSSVELHINLGVDPKQADQNIRGTVVLPNGTGKTQVVAVFAPVDMHKKAKDAGADIVGESDFLDRLKSNKLDFDVLISTPDMMPQLGRFAKLLGPKGLMPNPKSGTVTKDVAKAVSEAKSGRVEYRIDKQGIVHVIVGKVSFGSAKLLENLDVLISSIKSAKPSSVKGNYIQSIWLTTTMGPSVKVQI